MNYVIEEEGGNGFRNQVEIYYKVNLCFEYREKY